MASPYDLTTLAEVKALLKIESTADDRVLQRQLTAASSQILAFLGRTPFLQSSYIETFDGRDNEKIFLSQWPVTSVEQLVIDGMIIPQAPTKNGTPFGYGWAMESWNGALPGGLQVLSVNGGCRFARGKGNIAVTYTAGYVIQNEAATVPAAASAYAVAAPQGRWTADIGVTYVSTGSPLTLVSSAPVQGQYTVSEGSYGFAGADFGASVLISYSFIPAGVEDACINWTAERYKRSRRIGMRSETAGQGQTTSYDLSDIPAYILSDLNPYKKKLPV